MLIVPGAAGEIGVLARHAPLVATLKAGSTRVHVRPDEVVEFATGPGFFTVQFDRAIALVDDAQKAAEIDRDAAQRQLDEAEAELAKVEAGGSTPDRRMLQQRVDHPQSVAGDPDILNLTRPEVVLEIHRAYFAAGADIATTNTFTATTIGQADYGLEGAAAEMSLEGARLARAAADAWSEKMPDKPRFVAGSMGPLNVTLSLSPRVEDPAYRAVTFDRVRE